MKRAVIFFLCAALALPAFAFRAEPPVAQAAEADTRNVFQYDMYETGGYYEINFYLDIYKDTADEINRKCGSTEKVSGNTGIEKLFNSIESFFYAYENLFFDKTYAHFQRYTGVRAFHSTEYPFHSFNMYIGFRDDDKMSAAKKYNKYFGYEDGKPLEPTKKGFFADKYETERYTHFYVPEMLQRTGVLTAAPVQLPEYEAFRSGNFYFDNYFFEGKAYGGVKHYASLNAVMMPFLFYGSGKNIGFADYPGKSIGYDGLVNIFPEYFSAKQITRAGIFRNYALFHSLSTSTAYVKTDVKAQSSMGEYMHVWEISYSDPRYDANRPVSVTYIEPNILNLYFFAMIIAAAFIVLMLLFFYGLPRILKKEKTGNP